MLIALGACSQLSKFTKPFKQAEPEPTPAPSEIPASNTDVSGVKALPELTFEQLLLQDLSARPNSYALTKRELAAHVKETMLSALRLFQAGDLVQSSALVTQVINNELNLSSSVYVLAGDIALAQAEKAEHEKASGDFHMLALQNYKKALSLNADNAKAANRLAKIMREQGEFETALKLYTQAINSQPMHASSYRNRAVLYDLYLNQKAEALSDYQHYVVLLQWQQSQAQQGLLELSNAQQKALNQDLKIAKRWLVDLKRQVKAIEKARTDNGGAA